MQNRKELRQKGHDGSRQTTCREKGKKYHFLEGGGNIVFGPKYRPLHTNYQYWKLTILKTIQTPEQKSYSTVYFTEKIYTV
jgi:hypothetical protein